MGIERIGARDYYKRLITNPFISLIRRTTLVQNKSNKPNNTNKPIEENSILSESGFTGF